MIVNETQIKVRYAETDQMGVVYHANYLVWMEIGQTYITRKMYPIPVPQAVETAGSQSSNYKHHHGTKKKKRK